MNVNSFEIRERGILFATGGLDYLNSPANHAVGAGFREREKRLSFRFANM